MATISIEELDRLLAAMIQSAEGVSDLLFVAGKPPQVEAYGRLKPFSSDPPESGLTSERIESLARAILNENERLLQDLAETGSCDCSYALVNFCRFRVNIYRQNGNCAMVLRRLQTDIPSIDTLHLPPVFREVIKEKNGIVFVTGGTGSGKTTTLAAMLHAINQTSEVHIITLEDPIEFLHPHLKATFSQRELGRDFYTFPQGLRAALRQAPKIILVGEIRDRETMDIALTAAETGHIVFTTLHTISAGQTVNRILGMFSTEEEERVRERLAETVRYAISQRLVPQKTGGRLLVTEVMGSNLRTREAIALGESDVRRFNDIIEASNNIGWHTFEYSLVKAYEEDLITEETALLYCVNKPQMHQRIDAVNKRREAPTSTLTLKMKTAEPVPRSLPRHPPVPKPDSTIPSPPLSPAGDAKSLK